MAVQTTGTIDWSNRGQPGFEAAVVEKHLRLAKRLATRYVSSTAKQDYATYESAAYFGLLKAIRGYDPTQGTAFTTYAGLRIMGHMKDAARANDHAPRMSRIKIRKEEGVQNQLAQELGRQPTIDELAAKLGEQPKRARRLSQLDQAKHDQPSRKRPVRMSFEQTEAFRDATAGLNLVEQTLLFLYYYREATMAEIGSILGFSESRTSQLHTDVIVRLRANANTRDKILYAISISTKV